MLLPLVQNISLIVLLALIYHYAERRFRAKRLTVSLVNGLFLGFSAILAMSSPLRFPDGIIYDSRTIIHGIAGNFGGPVVALVAAVPSLLFRFFVIGGSGKYAGVLTIILSSLLGVGAFFLRNKSPQWRSSLPRFWLIGLAIHLSMLASQFFLPDRRWETVLPAIAPSVLLFFPIGYTLIAALFLESEERSENIHKLEESEKRYRLLFNNHHTTMFLVDPRNGRIVDANPAAEVFYGWPRETLLSLSVKDINTLSPELVDREMAAENRKTNTFHFRHRTASGDIRDVEVFTGPVELFGEKLLYSIIHDETARVEAERKVWDLNQSLETRVAQRTKELEETNKELESFAYSVSHDLRAPLRSIEGFSSLLAEESGPLLPSASSHYLERIRANATRMSILIDDILRLSRIGRQQLSKVPMDLAPLARSICAEMVVASPDRRVKVDIQSPLPAYGDPSLVEVILRNLISNAWKFSAATQDPHIKLYAVDSGNEIAYCVEDNGIGFDMAFVDKLFAPFQRLHGEQEYSGSGIGLSIVRRIAVRHGGRAWATAEPGKGARFYFSIGGQT
ncbi:MAG: PAS/PAC sensor signal transduction histidine kinase [Spirochaetes bacterium]|nr:MAG: PAS/PAC sensor signal transduction histidine kinase [Spirochaetota bacterium]